MTGVEAGDLLSGDKFYKVLKVTAKTMLLQQIGSKTDRSIDFDTNYYFWRIPIGEPVDEPFRCAIKEMTNWQNACRWWIAKYSDIVEKYDGTPVSWKIWNYGDNISRIAFDQSLYDSACTNTRPQ